MARGLEARGSARPPRGDDLNTVAAAADSESSADEFDMENHMHIVVLVAAIAHTSSTSSAFPKA